MQVLEQMRLAAHDEAPFVALAARPARKPRRDDLLGQRVELRALSLERVRLLFDDLETKREVAELLGRAEQAEGVRIFIGSENKLFSLSGSSTIIAPYRDGTGRIVGVIGVIGPTRLNYARIIPMVDYTSKVVGKLLAG